MTGQGACLGVADLAKSCRAARSGLSVAALCVLVASAAPTVWAQSVPATAVGEQAAAGVRHYAVAAGPLSQVLLGFAAEAGVQISVNQELVAGRSSAGVQGAYTVDGALAALLQGSGFEAVAQGSKRYTLRPVETVSGAQAAGVVEGKALPAVTVTGARLNSSTEGSQSYAATTIDAFKSSQSIRRTPQPVTVVTRQQLDDQATTDLNAVMYATPGVTVDYTDSERLSYYARGHQIDRVQFDGVSLDMGGSAFVQTDMAVIDHMEVVRGATGLLRGAGKPSAAVNLVRKKPTADFKASAELTLGSWDKRRIVGDVSGKLNEDASVRGRVVVVADDKDFFQKARYEEKKVFYGVLEADLADRTLLRAGYQYTDLNASGAWGNLPRDFDGSSLDLPRNTYLGAAWNQWDRFNTDAFVELEHAFDNDWSLKLAGSHKLLKLKDFKQTYFARPTGATNPYLFNVTTSIYDGDISMQSALSADLNGPVEILGRRHELMFGADVQRVKKRGSIGMGNQTPVNGVDIRDWDPYTGIPAPTFEISGNATNNYTRQKATYGAARLSVSDPLTVIVGSRLTWWEYEAPASATTSYKISREWTPYMGVVYDLNDQWSVYGSYTEIFEPQRAYDGNGQILDPMRGESYEAGLKGEWFDGRLNAGLSLFRVNNVGKAMDDESTPNPCMPNYTSGYCKLAGGKTRSEGFELELAGEIAKGWNLSTGYTHTRTEYLRDSSANNVGKPLRTHDPRHLFKLFNSYRFQGALSGLTLGAGVQAQSEISASSGGITYRQGGYAIYNAMAQYQFNRDWSVQLNINNVFDKVYYKKIGGGISNYYGDPRNAMVTLRAQF
ncbi:TonB-dependent siderophore receptor [Lampropedia puyangensis]|uniref:TonB-dependent siderophore receptor n=2 Tax=Lampropedia puyangensis TaxID=1330072 RepID=A0A4S8EUX4_9BURK|nr:TonB-dependent siderophore receptor [Lampropedia puyangensis]